MPRRLRRPKASERQPDGQRAPPQHGRELVSGQPHELKYLAKTHGASVEEVQEVIREVGSRSRRLIEQELDKQALPAPPASGHGC